MATFAAGNVIYGANIYGLSTEEKPVVDEAGNPLVDGSSFYCVDTGDVYLYFKGTWYKQ